MARTKLKVLDPQNQAPPQDKLRGNLTFFINDTVVAYNKFSGKPNLKMLLKKYASLNRGYISLKFSNDF